MHITARGPSLVTVALALIAIAVPAAAPSASDPVPPCGVSPAPPVAASPGCAPVAPLALTLTVVDAGASAVTLDYALVARLDLTALSIDVDLEHGGRVLSHARPAAGPMGHGVTRSGRVRVELPEGARRGEHAAEVRVLATSAFVTDDGSLERIVADAAVVLGDGPLPVTATPVVTGGQLTLDVPARHEGGAR